MKSQKPILGILENIKENNYFLFYYLCSVLKENFDIMIVKDDSIDTIKEKNIDILLI